MPEWAIVAKLLLYKLKRLLAGWKRVRSTVALRGGQRAIGGFVIRRARTASDRDDLVNGDAAAPAAKRDYTDTAASHRTQTEIAFPPVRAEEPEESSGTTTMPPFPPDDDANGASAVRTADKAHGGDGDGSADGATPEQVHATTDGTPATDTYSSSTTDHKRKRNDTSGSAKAMRAWLLSPGGRPPSTTAEMKGVAAVCLGLSPPLPTCVLYAPGRLTAKRPRPADEPGTEEARVAQVHRSAEEASPPPPQNPPLPLPPPEPPPIGTAGQGRPAPGPSSLGRRTRAWLDPGYPPPRDSSIAGRFSGAGGRLPIRYGVGGFTIKFYSLV